MPVYLHESLERIPGWREMADYANENMPDYLAEYAIYIRPATEIEERRVLKYGDGGASVEFDPDRKRFELVFSLADHLEFDELKRLFESRSIHVSDAMLLEIWTAQGNIEDPRAFAEAHILSLDPLMFEDDDDDEIFDEE